MVPRLPLLDGLQNDDAYHASENFQFQLALKFLNRQKDYKKNGFFKFFISRIKDFSQANSFNLKFLKIVV